MNGGNTVVVGRDTRPSAAEYAACEIDALCDAGWDIVDLGIVPTPTLQLAITKFDAAFAATAVGTDQNQSELARMFSNRISHRCRESGERLSRRGDT